MPLLPGPPRPAAPTSRQPLARGLRGRPGAPPACVPPRPRRPAPERPLPRGLQVGPASCSRSPPREQQRRPQPGPAVTYRRLMVPQRPSSATVLMNRSRQLGASLGSPAGPHSQPFKHRRARPAGIATPWAASRAPPSSDSAPSDACRRGTRVRGGGAPSCPQVRPTLCHKNSGPAGKGQSTRGAICC
jgi:hypothetical protein